MHLPFQALVFYGTETGTSRRYAEHLFDFLNSKFDVKINDISECSVDLLKKNRGTHMVFFIASTFGNGDAPTTAKAFAAELKKTVATSNSRLDFDKMK